MNIQSTFKEVAEKENAVFTQKENKYKGGRGSYLFATLYRLECDYRGFKIILKNELGHQNIGEVHCRIEKQPANCEFAIETTSTIKQFFRPSNHVLTFIGENLQLRNFVELNKAFQVLNKRAVEDAFEPHFACKNEADSFTIKCEYHLIFNNKELVIEPFIHFYKGLIDFFIDSRLRYN